MNISRRAGRACITVSIFFVVASLLFYFSGENAPAYVPPLPGTYQYFGQKDFLSTTHKLGAVSHCDPRFALDHDLDIDEFGITLRLLLSSYLTTMRHLDVATWLAHGTLLGWHWNRKLMPWDTDIDVQMSFQDLSKLAAERNMSTFEYTSPETGSTRKYLLDINPFYSLISLKDVANRIDGRWIDTTNGKFIDITAVHRDKLGDVTGARSSLFCKDGHQYLEQDIFPLVDTTFEGSKAKVPRESAKVLSAEYGPKSLTNTRFHWHKFDQKSQEWIPE